MRPFLVLLTILSAFEITGQPNCIIYDKNSQCFKACDQYIRALELGQGSFQQEILFDSALAICPSFSHAWREKSVAYLKNGMFVRWKELMDKAVEHNPHEYLGIRAWCRFKFLRDYDGALSDLDQLLKVNGNLGFSNDGDYDLRVVEALCHRELNNIPLALSLFDQYILAKETNKESLGIGLYDYLHRGVTLLQAGEPKRAIRDFEKQVGVYKELPDTYYYFGLAYLQTGDKEKALNYFTEARTLFQKGYQRHDTYTESPDKVYPEDVLAQLK